MDDPRVSLFDAKVFWYSLAVGGLEIGDLHAIPVILLALL